MPSCGSAPYILPHPAIQHVTNTAAVNQPCTAIAGPGGPGTYVYLVSIELVKLYAVVGVASGAGVIITTTNINGNPSFTTEQIAAPVGTANKVISLNYAGNPLRASAANVSCNFTAPAQLQTIWRWNISFYWAA